MAIAIDSTTKPWARVDGATSMTVAHTCSWTDRAIVVNVWHQVNVTSVTYAWVAMTQVGTTSTDGAANKTSTFVLANPASWANNVVITVASSSVIMCEIASYTWVDQSSPVWASVTNWPTTTTSWTQTITTTTDNSWLIMCAKGRNWSTLTAWSNTFIRVTIEVVFTWLFIADSNSAQTPTGSKSLNVTSASQEFNGTMFELNPAATSSIKTINWLAYASIKTVNWLATASMKSFNWLQ